MKGGMGALRELSSLVAENAELRVEKVRVLASLCPPPGFWKESSSGSRITARHLNGILAVAQFLAQSDGSEHRDQLLGIVLEFIRAVPSLPRNAFWPSSFGTSSAKLYFPELLGYVRRISATDWGASLAVSGSIADVIRRVSAGGLGSVEGLLMSSAGARAFFSALGHNCPFLHLQDAEQVISCLLQHWTQSSTHQLTGMNSGAAAAAASTISPPLSGRVSPLNEIQWESSGLNGHRHSLKDEIEEEDFVSPNSSTLSSPDFSPSSTPLDMNGELSSPSTSGPLKELLDESGTPENVSSSRGFRLHQLRFERQSTSALQRQEIAYLLLTRCLADPDDGSTAENLHVQQMRTDGLNQLRSLLPLLKIRKRDWPTGVGQLKLKISKMLQVSQAASILQIKSLQWLESDDKLLKIALQETLPVLMDAADACISSPWRRSKACEDLFESLIVGVAQAAAVHRSQVHRVLLRFKTLVLAACAQANTWGTTLGPLFESIIKGICTLNDAGWKSDKGAMESFLLSLAAHLREKDKVDKANLEAYIRMQLNVISFLADLSVAIDRSEIVELILPLFVESLEEGSASSPSLLRLKLLEAVGNMACLGSEHSYREIVVLLGRSYLDTLSMASSNHSRTAPAESTTERLETLPGAFLQIARGLRQASLRVDYRRRLLALCSDVGLAAEAKVGRIGSDLGALLPSVAEICSDLDLTIEVDPSLLKLFRNLWFYITLFHLAPPLPKGQLTVSKSANQGGILSHISSGLSQAINVGLISGVSSGLSTGSVKAGGGFHAWNPQWAQAVEQISERTPPLVGGSVKWLEDELELNALHPGSQRGSSNEKGIVAQRAALSAALAARVETSSLSGVTATYLLAIAILEVLRFKCGGGVIRSPSLEGQCISALTFVFNYLETPGLTTAVHQCLVATVLQAFSSAMMWLAETRAATGEEAKQRDAVIMAHASFLIKMGSHREDSIRNLADSLLNQMKCSYPQVLWSPICLHDLLRLVSDVSSSGQSHGGGAASLRSITHQRVRDWISQSLLLVPCTMQGLLQEQFRRLDRWQSASSDLLTVLSDLRVEVAKTNDNVGMSCIPAVNAAAAASGGVDPMLAHCGSLEVLSTGIMSANIKSNYAGEIAGMKRLYVGMGGLSRNSSYMQNGVAVRRRMSFRSDESHDGHEEIHDERMRRRTSFAKSDQGRDDSLDEAGSSGEHAKEQDPGLNDMLTSRFVQQLQQFVVAAEQGFEMDSVAFREACLRSAALLLSDLGNSEGIAEASSHLLRLLCWCPAHIFTPEAMETGLFVWTWVLSAAPQLGSRVLAELVDAWLWTVDTKKGFFASGKDKSGPAAMLRPQLTPGQPEPAPLTDPVLEIRAHRIWLGFFLDRYEAVRHGSSDQLLLFSRLLQGSTCRPDQFSSHPAAVGSFFTLLLFGLKFNMSQMELPPFFGKGGQHLLEDSIYRAGLNWFAVEPGWYDWNVGGMAQAEANSVARFLQYLVRDHKENIAKEDSLKRDNGFFPSNGTSSKVQTTVFSKLTRDVAGQEQRKQLLVMLCQSELDRLETWANPLKTRETLSRWRVGGDRWADYVKSAWAENPRIALSLVARFPGVTSVRTQVSTLVQNHILELYDVPEALPYIVTPKAVEEDSAVLQKLTHWAPCSITMALEFLTPAYKGHHRVLAYVLRVLETYPPERVTFFMPQLVQSLRHDQAGLVLGYLVVSAQKSPFFAHILIWQLQGEEPPAADEEIKDDTADTTSNMYDIAPRVRKRIIESFSPEAFDIFVREFRFFDKVTSISGTLYPLPKEERRRSIRSELEKIEVEGDGVYLPTAPNLLVTGIKLDSGIPLQSAAKVPIMITFEVLEKGGDPTDLKYQACIFKVGDDCRQDLLALQVISLMRDIFEVVGLDLYLFAYGVLPTGYGRGIIEVVPDTKSRNQLGEIHDGGLYEIFQQEYGPPGSLKFERARDNFIVSSAGYAVASLLLQPKDRHNGNLLFDSEGRLVHIDFGFILETSPGGNIRFESAQFKLSHEMTQLLDPSGSMKSEQWHRFVSLCVKGYLAARSHMDGIIGTVLLMVDSGLPCFSRGDPIGNLRKRLHPEMSEREAANFMIKTCNDAYNKWSTTGYDLIQKIQQGIEM